MVDQQAAGDRVARAHRQWLAERPDLDSSPMLVIARLHRLANHLTDELVPVYQQYGLSDGEFDVLATLRRQGEPFEVAPGELARHTMVTTGAVTKRLDSLERAGLVDRRPSPDDGRGRFVRLTPAGRELIDEVYTAHMRNERRLLTALSASEAAQLESLLARWLSEFEE